MKERVEVQGPSCLYYEIKTGRRLLRQATLRKTEEMEPQGLIVPKTLKRCFLVAVAAGRLVKREK